MNISTNLILGLSFVFLLNTEVRPGFIESSFNSHGYRGFFFFSFFWMEDRLGRGNNQHGVCISAAFRALTFKQ